MTYVFPALQTALERRDMDWQEHLAVLHEGFTGDGCDSGDPRDWTRAAIQMRINSLIDERDEAREQLRLANIDAAESEANDLAKEKKP